MTGHATHQGELVGIPPKSREVAIPDIVINRISEGRIEEGWLNYDALGLMQQPGVIPQPEQSEEANLTQPLLPSSAIDFSYNKPSDSLPRTRVCRLPWLAHRFHTFFGAAQHGGLGPTQMA